jgi:hypothetical protein
LDKDEDGKSSKQRAALPQGSNRNNNSAYNLMEGNAMSVWIHLWRQPDDTQVHNRVASKDPSPGATIISLDDRQAHNRVASVKAISLNGL